jgi:hypothetical protein
MSEYTSDSYSYTAETAAPAVAAAAGLETAIGALGAVAGVGGLAIMSTLAICERFRQQGAALERQGCAPLDARLKALGQVPLLNAAVAATGTPLGSVAGLTVADFDRRLYQAEERLFQAEGTVLRAQLGGALAELGYTVVPPRRAQETAPVLLAHRPDGTAVAARISPRAGRVELDLSGFRGDACQVERARLDAALRKRGVRLTTEARQRHQTLAGAALTRAVEAELGPRPAQTATQTKAQRLRT